MVVVGVTEPTDAEETDVQFEVNVAPVGTWSVVAVAGEVDVATAPRLRKETIALVADGHHRVVLDLEAVDFMDSTGLGVLIGVLRRIRAVGGALRVVCSTPRIVDLFHLTGLDAVFDIRPTLADAVADGPPEASGDAGGAVAAGGGGAEGPGATTESVAAGGGAEGGGAAPGSVAAGGGAEGGGAAPGSVATGGGAEGPVAATRSGAAGASGDATDAADEHAAGSPGPGGGE